MNTYKQVNEPISVVALFKGTKIRPLLFKWAGRDWSVRTVNLVHSTRTGREKLTYFSVSDAANTFKLCFNSETLTWRLEEVWSE